MTRIRMNRARWLAIAGLVLAIGTSACGGDDDDDSSSAAKDGALEGTLTVWQTAASEAVGPWYEEFNAAFERKHPGVTVEFTAMSTDEQLTKPAAAFSAGDEPDIMGFDAGELLDQYVRAGKIAPLNDLVDFDVLNKASLDLFTDAEGDINGVPGQWDTLLLWGNSKVLSEHDATLPETWDELLATCEKLKGEDVIPIALGTRGQDQFTTTHWYDTLLYQYGGGDVAFDATYGENGASWTDPEFVQAAERLQELTDAGCFPDGFTGLSYAQMTSLFVRGQAAMIFTGTWFASSLAGGEGEGVEVDLVRLPDAPDAANSTADGMIGGTSGLAATTKGVERHSELVAAYLNEWAKAADEHASDLGVPSVAAEPTAPKDPVRERVNELIGGLGEFALWPHLSVPSTVRVAEFENVLSLASGELSPDEWAQTMAEDVERERDSFPEREKTP